MMKREPVVHGLTEKPSAKVLGVFVAPNEIPDKTRILRRLARHRHAHFQMIYCLGGSGRFLLEDREYPLTEGSLFLIKPRREHGLEPSPNRLAFAPFAYR